MQMVQTRTPVNFSDLKGKIVKDINVDKKNVSGDDQIRFKMMDGSVYQMHHVRDCCEQVWIEDICGDLDDLIGYPIVLAESNSSRDKDEHSFDVLCTWTFYRIATQKGGLVIRWCGTSNGYYSEEAHFDLIDNG